MVNKTTRPTEQTEDLAAGGVESLDAIAAAGQELDATAPADTKAEQAVLASEAEEIASALQLLRAAAVPFAPDHIQEPLLEVWSNRQLLEVARAIVDLARMYGLTVGQLFENYGPWIRLVMALGLPALATLKLLRIPPPRAADGQHQPA